MWITFFLGYVDYFSYLCTNTFIFGTAIVYEIPKIITESFVCAAHRLIPVALKRVLSSLHLLHTVTHHAVLIHNVTYVNSK